MNKSAKAAWMAIARVTACGFVLCPLPAFACGSWNVSGESAFIQSNASIVLNLSQSGNLIQGSARWFETKPGTSILGVEMIGKDPVLHEGSVDGTLEGTRFSVQIYWRDGAVGVYTGEVASSGRINGSTYDRFHPNNRAEFYSEGVLKCADAPPPAKPIHRLGKQPSSTPVKPSDRVKAAPPVAPVPVR